MFGIEYMSSKDWIERCLHDYYYQLLLSLCDYSTSITCLSDNFDDDIYEFILERGSHPGIPLFHNYRKHHLSSYDYGFLSPNTIHIQLTNLSLMLKFDEHIIIHTKNDNMKTMMIMKMEMRT